MPLIEWSNLLSLGVKHMDHQHQMLIGIINRLAEGYEPGDANTALDHNAVLGEMMRYALVHFEFEAELMKGIGYQESVSHLEGHQSYVAQVMSFQDRMSSQDKPVAQEFLEFLRNWWVSHILNTDRDLATALNAKGIR
jgi:hemerythrin-like metal-binding protein